MWLYKQEIMHNPEAGQYGDCQRAAIATVLQIPIDQVPHFGEGGPDSGAFFERVRQFLQTKQLGLFSIPFQNCPLEDILRMMDTNNPCVIYMLSGMSPRGVNHVVVCKGGEIIHDPHPSNDRLVGPCDDGHWWVDCITPTLVDV